MRRLILLGAVIFCVGVVALFPASVAYQWFVPPSVQLSGISGTVWSGRATQAQVNGFFADNLDWRWKPSSLFGLRIAYGLSMNPAGGVFEGDAAVLPGGNVRVSNATGGIALSSLNGVLPLGGIDGNVRLDLDELELRDGFPVAADGTVDILGLVARNLSPAPVGDFRIVLSGDDGNLLGRIESLDGSLNIDAELSMSPDRSYVLEGLVGPTPQTSRTVVQQLEFLGSANAEGLRPFRFEGRL